MALPVHHPADDQLASYAAGGMAEAPALVIATHLALCPLCRRQVSDFEALGGALLADLGEEPLAACSLSQTLAKLDEVSREKPKLVASAESGGQRAIVPQPLRDYMDRALVEKASWRKTMPGLRTLKLKADGAKVWLMEIDPGRSIPHHGHSGSEMVQVLTGGYHDGAAAYGPGDLHMSGPETFHEPVADPGDPCLCLVTVEGSLKLSSLLGRVLSRLLGF
jgi:putative transcriptional regulator